MIELLTLGAHDTDLHAPKRGVLRGSPNITEDSLCRREHLRIARTRPQMMGVKVILA